MHKNTPLKWALCGGGIAQYRVGYKRRSTGLKRGLKRMFWYAIPNVCFALMLWYNLETVYAVIIHGKKWK